MKKLPPRDILLIFKYNINNKGYDKFKFKRDQRL